MTPSTLREAAFWHQAICFDCDESREPAAEQGEREPPCTECGSPRVWLATDALEMLNRMEPEDETSTRL